MTINNYFLTGLLFALLILTAPLKTSADEASLGYQLALMDERAQNPQKALTQKTLRPSNAAVREFEWILETLRARCRNPQKVIITTLVESWRMVQRRGYDVSLLTFSRQITDFSNFAFQARQNRKMDIDKVASRLIQDKYPPKK